MAYYQLANQIWVIDKTHPMTMVMCTLTILLVMPVSISGERLCLHWTPATLLLWLLDAYCYLVGFLKTQAIYLLYLTVSRGMKIQNVT